MAVDGCSIHLDGQNLVIRADRRSTFNDDNKYYHQRDIVSGRVERTFNIPNDAQVSAPCVCVCLCWCLC